MESFEVIDTDRSFSSKDYCFLPELLVHCVKNGSVLSNENSELENIKTASPTSTFDVSMDEVNAQLKELSDANKLLNETLSKSNLLLKNQSKILPIWQENKQNLEKAKKNIDRLEKENADLHSRLSSLEIENLDLKNQKTCKNCESLSVALQILRNDKESAKKTSDLSGDISKFKHFLQNHKEILMLIDDQLLHLYKKCQYTDRQKEELNSVLICLKKEISVLSGDFHSIVHTEHETRNAIGEKEQKVSEEIMLQAFAEIENLKKALELKNEKLHTFEELMLQTSTEMENLKKELEERDRKLNTSEELMIQTSTEMENLKKELEEKDKKLYIFEEVMCQTYSEIENLRKELEEKNKKAEDAEALLRQSASEVELLRKILEAKDKKAENTEAMFRQNINEVVLLRKNMEVKDEKLDLSNGQEKQLCKIVEGYVKKIQDIGKELKSQLEELENKLDNELARTKNYEKLCQYVLQQRDLYQVKLNCCETSNIQIIIHLRKEAVNLQKSLKVERKANQKDKERLSVLMMQCEELHLEYIRAIQFLEVEPKNESYIAEDFTILSENDIRSREMIDHLTARVLDLDLKLVDKEEDMKKLLEELVSAKDEAKMVPILQTELSDLKHAVASTVNSEHNEEIENLEKEFKKYRKEDADSSGYYSSKKRNGL